MLAIETKICWMEIEEKKKRKYEKLLLSKKKIAKSFN